ncbi:hypothetical protein MM326_18685 [Alkalihalobacillus sp. LMS6]|uniref:hypothetical protein n=1 Tax=Alkalihalobacillus sp. LMS6 TaxID=2924034 RepID=UPI0020D0F2F7|nr:hypothetical protein [Alkalihalobacillus sp. LMS6]UTR06081.1 hypothetical protein MM326_18685 [Alkalihalobacillus sp. LMS6]
MIKVIFRPHIVIIITIILSGVAWWFPLDSRKGFLIQESLTSQSVLLLLFWYLAIIFSAYIGFSCGKKIKPIKLLNVNNDKVNNYFYWIISLLSFIGVLSTYSTIVINNPNFLLDVLNANANQLKYALYENYSQGFHSLRYLTIVSGAIAVLRIIKKQHSIVNWMNIAAVLLTALVSSRLAIVMLIVLLMCNVIHRQIRVKKYLIVTISLITFIALAAFNYSRNANFYNDNYNLTSPIVMNIAEMITYLGAPFQATLGVLNNIEHFNHTPSISEIFSFIIPETFHGILGLDVNFVSTYRNFVDIEASLTTNSSLVLLVDSIGYYSLFIVILTVLIYSILIGHFNKYSNALVFISYVFLYCIFEIWRLFLFNQGIIHTLTIGIIISYISSLLIYKLTRSKFSKEGK